MARLTKIEKETIVLFNEGEDKANIYTHNAGLKKRLAAFAKKYPLVICTMTGLTIVITGSWNVGLEGVSVTTRAFQMGLPLPAQFSSFILMLCLVFFAFTTILGWNYYSERCLEYLIGDKKNVIKAYKWLYILCIFIGPFMTVSAVWTIADIFNGLMAIPNLIALIALNGVVVSETNKYINSLKK